MDRLNAEMKYSTDVQI